MTATGVHPDDTLFRALLDAGIDAVSIGNCNQLGKAIDAIRAGCEAGMHI